MRKTIAVACVAVLACVLAPAGSASAADTCLARATWTVEWSASYAVVNIDRTTATGAACAALLPADGARYSFYGAWAVGVTPMLATEIITGGEIGTEDGVFKVTGGDLDAVLRGTTADGRDVLAVHDGDGSLCGPNCYRTKGVWTGS